MKHLACLPLMLFAFSAAADEALVTINKISAEGVDEAIGTIRLSDTPQGLSLTPALHGLPAAGHGFHVHENPGCGPKEKDGKPVAGLAAGAHYDPMTAGKHEGPHGKGHLGDLPLLEVAADGTASQPLLAPHLKVSDVKGHSIMIHEGGDNYADQPKPLGGGGARIACGVLQ